MPLLMCPNCTVATQSLQRHGVELDMCPQCRGVWLDRGELEKILEMERANLAPPGREPDDRYRRPEPRYEHGRDDDHRRQDDKRHGHKRRRSILDIFDD